MSTATLHPIDAGSITSIPGFDAAGVAAGIKANGALDVASSPATGPALPPPSYHERLQGGARLTTSASSRRTRLAFAPW